MSRSDTQTSVDRGPKMSAESLLAAIVDSSDDAIISKNLDSVITSWNKAAERIFGYTAEEAIGQSVLMLIPEERLDEETEILARLKRGERVDHYETVRLRKDGSLVNLSLTISPIRDKSGRVVGASKIARDITHQSRTDEILYDLQRRYASALEQRVEETTAELSRSQERLRNSERLAALGTLSAGLGHDMGNVLMPLRAHLDAIAGHVADESKDLQQHFEAIRRSIDYLRTLSSGLRMLAIGPDGHERVPQRVDLDGWWEEALPLLRTAVGSHYKLKHSIPRGLPPVAIAPHSLTQAVFNLVQNSAQAMAGPPMQVGGEIEVIASRANGHITIAVKDNGPGMTRIVKDHCLEPYFSTKARGVATGLGLALVHGTVQSAGGTLEIESEVGRGATFTMVLPAATEPDEQPIPATMSITSPRLRALLHHLLRATGFTLMGAQDESEFHVTDDPACADQFLIQHPIGHVLCFSDNQGEAGAVPRRVTQMNPSAPTSDIRRTLESLRMSSGVPLS